LSPYDALEKGVSRRHMMVSREHDTVAVMDLGSANSTYLNGQRLLPSEPRILRDNDELRLGRLVIRVTFAREN
ncbi:MAG: FHA domain-containing protein, partial [Chloroflexi bacterium]|nr:FHA domain-containing protein [Chloroflexota bacterium]